MFQRRSFLQQLIAGVGSLNLANVLRLQSSAASPQRTTLPETALIILWQDGGPSQFETFDPKPEATAEIRGDLGSIATRQTGIQFCDVLPRLAALADRFTILRSLTQASSNHVSATHTFITGYDRTGVITGPPENPDLAVVVNRMRNSDNRRLPAYVGLPEMPRGGPAYLGPVFGALKIRNDPSAKDFHVDNLRLAGEVGETRFGQRTKILAELDQLRRTFDAPDRLDALDEFQQRAIAMLTSPDAARAFDLAQEPDAVRQRYGMHKAGQQALLARRLVEAGVSVVGVRFHPTGPWHDSWDDHPCGTHVFGTMKGRGPLLDQAVSALVEDLGARGLDQRVMVLMAGEFGRTPRIRNFNGVPGRDHWGPAGSALVYGGGMRMGQVIGATNRHGERPVERPVKPQDVLATIYQFLGINPHHEFINLAGRPLPILPHGDPIAELLG